MANSLFVFLILFSLIPVAYGEGVYLEVFNYPGVSQPIILVVVDEQDDFPDSCQDDYFITIGCAVFGTVDRIDVFMLILDINHLNTTDRYGNSPMWHELKHIICECDWHGGANK